MDAERPTDAEDRSTAKVIEACVLRALREDLGGLGSESVDITTNLTVPAAHRGEATIVAKAAGILSGMAVARYAFQFVDPKLEWRESMAEGDALEVGDVVLRVAGQARALLLVERTVLNFMQRMSGIATMTSRFVDAVRGTSAKILDTRKTTPGLRWLEKAAVVAGGGVNHRVGLHDQVLLKENHFAMAGADYEAVVRAAVAGSAAAGVEAPVVAEARNIDEACAAVRGGAGIVMLDNFGVPEGLRAGVAAVREEARGLGTSVLVEASGGVNLGTVRTIAETGVDRISVGAITHSVPALDLSMLIAEAR